MAELRTSELAQAVGISKSHASGILTGNGPAPSRRLAFRIFAATGRKFGPIAGLSDEDVATLARIEAAGAEAA